MASYAKVNFIWTIAVLTAIVIGLLTYDLGNSDDIVSYIGFAATISSLLLAVVAIVYSFLSNVVTASNLAEVKSTAQQMSSFASAVSAASEKLDGTAGELRSVVNAMPTALADLGSKVDQHSQFLQEALKSTASPKAQTTGQPDVAGESAATSPKEYLSALMESSSVNGLCALFISHLSFKSGKVFDAKFLESLELFPPDYLWGYLIALEPSKVVDIEVDGSTWKVLHFVDCSTAELRKAAIRRIDETDFAPEWNDKVKKRIVEIDRYFS